MYYESPVCIINFVSLYRNIIIIIKVNNHHDGIFTAAIL